MSSAERSGIEKKIITAARTLKPMRSSVIRVLNALDNPASQAARLANLISMDQVLTAEVLKVANSALLGYGHSCASVQEGVVRLGTKRIRVIALGVGASGSMSVSLRGYSLGGGDLMRHAVATATIALWLAQALNHGAPEEVYVAGLLHDIGKLLLDQYLLEDRQRIAEKLSQSRDPLWLIEENLFGINHADAGGLIARHWRFPLPLVDAIRSHHNPARADRDEVMAALVNLANAFTPNDSNRSDFLEGRYVHESTLEILDLDPSRLEELRHDCSAAMKMGN